MHSPTTCTPMLLLLVSSMLSLSVLAISGEATFYYPEGNAGACGRVFGRNDYIAAPPPGHFSGGGLVLECPSCHGAFNALANEGAGRIRVDWQWVDCGNRYGRSSIGRTHVEAGFGEPQNFTTPESGHNETESDTGHHA
ncbi:hypothetical protein BC829DRAFT_392563 [Chytridium lagenaria]|nr:hypothetical protein BC829DRAFT_392563 [Chytridium lagenaria]